MNRAAQPATQSVPEHTLLNAQVNQLYAASPTAVAVNLVNATLLSIVQWPVIDHTVLLLWLAAGFVIGVFRLRVTRRHSGHIASTGPELVQQERQILIAIFAFGLFWGSATLLLFPPDNLSHQVFLAFVLAGMSAGSIASLGGHRNAPLLYLLPILPLLSLRLLWEGSVFTALMGLYTIIFLLTLLSFARQIRNRLSDNVRMRSLSEQSAQALRQERRLFTAGPTVVFRWSASDDWPVEYVSSNVTKQFGYPVESFYGEDNLFRRLIHPDDQARVDNAEFRHEQGEELLELEYRIRDASGQWRWIYDITYPGYDEQGELTYLYGYVIDITERKANEEALQLAASAFETHEAIIVTDTAGNITRTNRAFTRMTGYSSEEVIGKNPSLLKSGKHDAPFYQQMWQQLAQAGHWEGEIWNRKKDGTLYPEWLSITSVHDTLGEISHYVAHFMDISQLKAQQEALEQQARMEHTLGQLLTLSIQDSPLNDYLNRALSLLIESLPWLRIQPRGAIFLASESHPGRLEMVANYNLSRPLLTLCENIDYGHCLCGRVAESGESLFASEVDHRHDVHFDGMEDHGHFVLPLKGDDQLLGVLTLYLEAGHAYAEEEAEFLQGVSQVLSLGITRRHSQQAMLIAKETAERANQAKSEFLSSMSHELRTPLNAILGFTQLLEFEITDSEQRDQLREVSRAGEHLLGLINEILDLARIESGRMDLSVETLDLDQVIAECISLTRPLADSHQVTLETASALGGLQVLGDYVRLKQVLLNLMSNGIKYNREHGTLNLTVEQPVADPVVRITVRDTGEGLSPEQQEKLFQPFERLGQDRKATQGTGIGLVITRSLVELMGGTIGVDSTLGEGSAFWVELPLAASPDGDRATPSPDDGSGSEMAVPGEATGSILYIEDNQANIKLVELLIARHPHLTLHTAMEPQDGLRLARELDPALILLDINLPGMDGFEVLRHLQQGPQTAQIPVIGISANAMPTDIERAHQAGFSDYLTKPFDLQHFSAVLEKWLDAPQGGR